MPDGSEIPKPIRLQDITYDELMTYDAGIAKGTEFKGTRVPRLDELLEAAADTDVIISLDKKIRDDELDPLLAVVKKYPAKISFSCKDTRRIRLIQEIFPDARIDYDGNTTEEDLEEILRWVRPENLQVWLYMDKPNFAWLTDRVKASAFNCARVKQYAKLGLGNICNPYDMQEALLYEPDIIEV